MYTDGFVVAAILGLLALLLPVLWIDLAAPFQSASMAFSAGPVAGRAPK